MLKIENVTYRYKNTTRDALKNVSAEMDAGKLYSIVGPSGSGKTTLLSLLAGLDAPTAGTIMVDETPLTSINPDLYRRERVTMVFQAFHLFPLLTAIENVCIPMQLNGTSNAEASKTAARLLQSVGIDSVMSKRYPSKLSGGEQQRVAIARSLSSGAKLILADEPTGNLDSENGQALMSILRNLAHNEDYCIVIVTHNPEIADACDIAFKITDGVMVRRDTEVTSE